MRDNVSGSALSIWILTLIFMIPTIGYGYVAITDYSALGQPGRMTYDNGIVTEYAYEAETGRLWTIEVVKQGQPLLSQEYDYYSNGNVNTILNHLDASRIQVFGYDELDRLTSAQSTVYGALSYAYDQIGNFQTKEGIVYTPDPVRPHAVGATSDGRSYAYDDNGNMTADGFRTFVWDYDNRPISITYGSTTTFIYDGLGNRVKKTGPAGTSIYIDKLYELSGGVPVKYIFANGQRIALKSAMNTYYYHVDHLGSTGVVTDQGGNKVEDIFYKPFGETASDTGSVSVNHKYTGQELDEETELYFYNARYYNPSLGRFVSADTIIPDPMDPQAFNRYSYVSNNPLRYIDPSGYSGERFVQDGGGSGGGNSPGGGYGGGGSGNFGEDLDEFLHNIDDELFQPIGDFFEDVFGGLFDGKDPYRPPINSGNQRCGAVYYGTSASQISNYSPRGVIGEDLYWAVRARMETRAIDRFQRGYDLAGGINVVGVAALDIYWPEHGYEVPLMVIGIGKIGKISKASGFFKGTKYSTKVLSQMKKGDFHSFPELVTNYAEFGKVSKIKGGDGIMRLKLEIPGAFRGKEGVFEFIKDSNGVINHRYFRPY